MNEGVKMNQILETSPFIYESQVKPILPNRAKKNFLIFFIFSVSICIILLFYLFFSFIIRKHQEQETLLLKEKYNLSSLYPSIQNSDTLSLSDTISIIGLIEIPSIHISYPILDRSNEDLLKISICRFSGPLPNRIGNMCLAGHNYRNTSMFSKLNQLEKGDSIYITDLNHVRLEYKIYDKFKVDENNLECTINTPDVQVTLITCREINNKERIVLKAKMKG